MEQMVSHEIKIEPAFVLKGSLFTLSVLQLLETDLKKIGQELAEKIRLAPKFFHYAPVVLDLSKLSTERQKNLEFDLLNQVLRQYQLIPVGVRGGSAEVHRAAQLSGFAIMMDSAAQDKLDKHDVKEKTTPNLADKTTISEKQIKEIREIREIKEIKESKLSSDSELSASRRVAGNLLITSPIRSGQQVYAHGGDLIVVASVSPGAELLADGNIHVYGTLRGRALAGINGDEKARVFCHRLQADLVAIAGHYKVFEEIKSDEENCYKQLYLQNGQLIIESL